MKFSQSGKYLIISVLCLGVGFIAGQFNMETAINLEGIKEAHYFGVHASYLRGCVENKDKKATSFQDCVAGAKNATADVREIMEKEPTVIYVDPQGKEIKRVEPKQPKTSKQELDPAQQNMLKQMMKNKNEFMI